MRNTDHQATMRTTRAEWDTWSELAAREGMSTAAWMRQACRDRAAGRTHRREDGSMVVGVELSPELAEVVEQGAKEAFRTPELHVLALLVEALRGAK